MQPLIDWLQKFLDSSDRLQSELSERWRLHANRRTVLFLVSAGIVVTAAYLTMIQPPRTFPVDQLVSVREGATLSEIAAQLREDGVIRSPIAFRIVVTVLGHEKTVHAGDYLFKQPLDVFSVARAIAIGAFGLEPIRIRITEGATTRSMAIIYGSQLLRFDPQSFLEKAKPLEGYLFPDTYFFLPNATEDTVIKTMRQNFDLHETEIAPLVASSSHSLSDIVIMASIVEREARNTADRKMIAGVLWNRIKRGMALQVDVTFLYTLGKGTFQLTMTDLRSDSPYNTYVNKGLPPGPIGSPSLDSLKAAADPTKSDYLFYLADNHGVTHFSKTYEQHLRYKRLYLGS
ncbi:endolytic transglycosylase MltG [Candidatus Kaiserbacteria bacterium]|nr:endolytic transglycosylase MltG [Candidatus Kaiserbacteria bacterium]